MGDLDAHDGHMNSDDLMLRVLLWIPAHGGLGNIYFQNMDISLTRIINKEQLSSIMLNRSSLAQNKRYQATEEATHKL